MGRFTGVIGMVALLGIAYLLSNNRGKIVWKTVIVGLLIQLVLAFLVLKTAPGRAFFFLMNGVVMNLLDCSMEGAKFLFGNLIFNNIPVGSGAVEGGPFVAMPGRVALSGAYFAFNVLPTIIFFSALMSVLYYLGVMQFIVRIFARFMMKFMNISGAESLSVSGNIFVGQTEAPLLIRPYVKDMTNSELMAVMVGGFATIAGGVMAAYVGLLREYIPNIAGHLMTASVMSAPAAIVMAKIILPETGHPKTAGLVKIGIEKTDANIIDAACNGAAQGVKLSINVGAMLMAFIALIAMLNLLLGGFGSLVNGILGTGLTLTLDKIFAWIFSPLAWVMGIPWKECLAFGGLLGKKIAINEFVAYLDLATGAHNFLGPRAMIIASYALCGFANFSSIAIQIGGISGIAPERRHDLAKIGLKAMIAGALASFMTATLAGMLIV